MTIASLRVVFLLRQTVEPERVSVQLAGDAGGAPEGLTRLATVSGAPKVRMATDNFSRILM